MIRSISNIFKSSFLLLLLTLSPFIYGAEDTNTCYSVQLASIYNKNSIYLRIEDYPSDCKLISLANLKAVRCGCYDDKQEAKTALKELRHKHHGSILVRTYKSRFEDKADIATEEKIRLEQIPSNETESTQEEREAEEDLLKEEPGWMQSLLGEGEFNIQGNVNLTAQSYLTRPEGKHKNNFTASGEIEAMYSKDDLSFVAKIYAQGDSYDMQGSSDNNHRSFVRLDELYIKQDFEDDQIQLGKSIQFWGALEARNITDVFNPDDLRSDIFDADKIGVWNASYTHYTETGELSLIVKFNEPDRKMAGFPYVYYFFPENIPATPSGPVLPLNYDDNLQKELSNRPSFFIKYTGSTDSEYALDYALIFENGYDSQRYYTYALNPDPTNVGTATSITTRQNAYFVNKLMTYNTLVVGATLIKLEAIYTNVISTNDIGTDASGTEKKVSDYYHIGVGLEHTLTQVNGDADLGLIAEYYKYGTIESGAVFTDLNLFEVNQNDLFLGARYSFNQGNDASIIGGGIFDLEYNEEVYYIEYEGRIADTFKLNLDYRYISPSPDTPTAFKLMGRHQRISAQIGYYF